MEPNPTERVKPNVIGASRSLNRLCSGPSDLQGLIAYGLFKIEQTEWAEKHTPTKDAVNNYHTTLGESRVTILRDSAQSKLIAWGQDLKEGFRAEIVDDIEKQVDQGAVTSIAERLSFSVRNEIKSSNKNWLVQAVLGGVVAWLVTLFLTALVAFTIYGPSIFDMGRKFLPK